MAIGRICALGLLSLCTACAAHVGNLDADRDGVPDDFEQALLRKFVPIFHISESDCDVAPAEFEQDSPEPKVKVRNGTIHGQVFPVHRAESAGAWIEIHYLHLSSKDCGQAGHALDAESVSVLLQADRNDWHPEAWRATYWYAAAHENTRTLCVNMSNAATARALGSFDSWIVWVSKDKHASFLRKKLCAHGCGNDEYDGAAPLRVTKLINLGEPRAPMNASEWTASALWPLSSKMKSDFPTLSWHE
jgi:hypothetical protein